MGVPAYRRAGTQARRVTEVTGLASSSVLEAKPPRVILAG